MSALYPKHPTLFSSQSATPSVATYRTQQCNRMQDGGLNYSVASFFASMNSDVWENR